MREMLSPTSAIMGKGLGKDRGAHQPTDGFPAAATASSSGTSRPKLTRRGRSRREERRTPSRLTPEKRELNARSHRQRTERPPQVMEEARAPATHAACWRNTPRTVTSASARRGDG